MRAKRNVSREYRKHKGCLTGSWSVQHKEIEEYLHIGAGRQRSERRKWEEGKMALSSRLTDD